MFTKKKQSNGTGSAAAGHYEINKDFSLKALLAPEFGFQELDILETLGTGTFGRVRLVRTLTDKKFYALKTMKKAKICRYNQLQHIQDEVRILSRIRCNFIVELYAVFQDDNSISLMLEYAAGGELFSHLRRLRKFDFNLYQFYSAELACAIRHMHEVRVAYRDIKPENILLTQSGHIRITDFGFAKIVDDRTYTLCGTPEYLSPEVIQGIGHGMSVDWWALGVLIYEMSMGYPPFYGDNPFAVYKKIINCSISYPSTLNVQARKVIGNFLTIDRTKRLGAGKGGFDGIMSHIFFVGIDWFSAAKELISPPMIPTVIGDGDSSNYDYYADEGSDEASNLTMEERKSFQEFDRLLDRPVAL